MKPKSFETEKREKKSKVKRKEKTEDLKEKIEFKEFVFIILNELLRVHFNFLGSVRKAFKRHDIFNNGFLNREEIEKVIETLDPQRNFSPIELVETLDPENFDVVCFSNFVKRLAEKTLQKGAESVSLLQFFFDMHD